MIDVALTFLVQELNDYLTPIYQPAEPLVVLSAHVGPDGAPAADIVNKISATLVNLEPEPTVRNLSADRVNTNGEYQRINPAIRLNLLVLLAANFNDYTESLKFLAAILTFFQGHGLFTPQTAPRLPPALDRLVVELEPTSYLAWSQLWGMLGTKYAPGAVYRLKMLTIQENRIQETLPPVRSVVVNQ